MAESKEELKSLLKIKEENENHGLKLIIIKKKDHGNLSHCFMTNRRKKSGSSERCHFLGLQNHYGW